jgi:trigger factor
MNSNLNDLAKGQKELIIELSSDELKPYLEKAVFNISKTTKISGFRQGKAPFDIVKKQVGEMTIYQEASHLAIRGTLFKALKEKNVEFIGEPKIDIEKLAPNNPFVYKATVSLLPKVEIGDYQKIKIKKKEIKVAEEDINKVLKNFQNNLAKEALKDGEIVNGDRVEIDFEASLDKVVLEGGKEKNYPLVIGSGQMIPGFEDKLIGLKKDQTKEFTLQFPEKYHSKQLAGKLTDFKIKINNVYQRTLPELNNDFAKQVGQVQTLEELKTKIKESLKQEKQHKESQKTEQEMLNEIIKISQFDEIPDILIDNESKKMISELKQSIEFNGLEFDKYLTSINKTVADLKNEFTDQALERVKAALIIRTIAKKLDIKVSPEEIKKHLNHLLQHQKISDEQKANLESEEYRQYLKNIILNQKTLTALKKELIS